MLTWAFTASLGLALVHVFAGRLYFLESVPRSVCLSAAGGISVAYVFLHLLPDLAEGQRVMADTVGRADVHHRHLPYVSALPGLAVFYGLECMAQQSRRTPGGTSAPQEPAAAVFWIDIASFCVYNVLVGYLLHSRQEETREFIFFFVAIALHFFVNDFGLRQHYRQMYQLKGRWILAGAVLAGWVLGRNTQVPEVVISMIAAFLVGVVILNVMKEELPEERSSSFRAFISGATLYAVILLLAA